MAAHGITHVLYAPELFGTERIPNIRAAFDVVDGFPEHEYSPAQVEEVRASHPPHCAEMDAVFGCFRAACENCCVKCSVAAASTANGADLVRLRSVAAEKFGVRCKN